MTVAGYSLGVDLGTAVLAAAVAGPDGVRPVALGDRAAVSAVVHVGDGGVVAIGDLGEQRAVSRPEGALRGLRHRQGGGTVAVDGATYAVTALLAAQLRGVLRRVADAEGGPPDRVVLTVPASWSAAQRTRWAGVAAEAGLAAPVLVTEAEAAVTALADRVRPGAVVAVYDLGAGFHATLVRRDAGGVTVLGAPEGDDRVGGLAFDDAVLVLVGEAVAAAGGSLAAVGDDPQALARLHRDCVQAKEALATAPEAVVPVALPERTVEVRLTRAGVEQRLREPLTTTMWALGRTIRSAGLLPSDVDAVLLLGGSSRMPLVRQLLAQQFGRPVLPDVDPKDPVSRGAALLGRAPAAARAPAPAGVGVRVGAAAGAVRAEEPAAAVPAGPGAPAGPGEPVLDPPTHLLVLPRTGSGRPLPPPDDDPPWWSRVGLPLAAAAAAALVLAGVFVLAFRGPAPPVVPAYAPPSPVATSAPVTTAAPSSTRAGTRTTTAPRTSRAPTSARRTTTTRAARPTTSRPRARATTTTRRPAG